MSLDDYNSDKNLNITIDGIQVDLGNYGWQVPFAIRTLMADLTAVAPSASPTFAGLEVTGSEPRIYYKNTDAANPSVDQSSPGIVLASGTANTTNKYLPAVMFASIDAQFTTTSPKIGAAIAGYATEAYAADTDGGMGIEFFTTPDNPGTGGGLVAVGTLDGSGNLAVDGAVYPSGSSDRFWSAGSGSPEGVVTAGIGSIYSRTDGGAGTSLYVKESGTGNTGWVAK